MNDTKFITDEEIYHEVLLARIPAAREFLWLGTSELKDLYVPRGRRAVPFLELLSELVDRNVSIRLLHASEPGARFRTDFDRYPNLTNGVEQILCPRVHFKCVIVDGVFAYSGSANLTGAGIGAKSPHRRNFESGIVTTDADLVATIMGQFDAVWMGSKCRQCRRKQYCAEFRE